MTREEAIKQLEIWRECMRVDLADPDVVETYNMAIQALSFDDTKYHEEHGEVVIADVVWEDALKALKALKAQQEPTGDLISRQAVLDGLAIIAKLKAKSDVQKSLMGRVMFFVERLPSAGKTGHWIIYDVHCHKACKCSNCNKDIGYENRYYKYCPNCGARMEGLQV